MWIEVQRQLPLSVLLGLVVRVAISTSALAGGCVASATFVIRLDDIAVAAVKLFCPVVGLRMSGVNIHEGFVPIRVFGWLAAAVIATIASGGFLFQ
eukprot:CAMPEP_0201598788 /NCGR_PEP_ID=MMETSP0492-20130828/493_1 /ASSEMBLY_ACC=CAM_ASM_000837 /TAXON_ID=420259 /ORGANISM="Thalassiosira gravida, Strain GMp14c1" /LENGTH=95 /DNA_ID=CAMNT_0048061265 /DNA_START=402 /DNA_END=689 /DNA_ORIENTATION=+